MFIATAMGHYLYFWGRYAELFTLEEVNSFEIVTATYAELISRFGVTPVCMCQFCYALIETHMRYEAKL